MARIDWSTNNQAAPATKRINWNEPIAPVAPVTTSTLPGMNTQTSPDIAAARDGVLPTPSPTPVTPTPNSKTNIFKKIFQTAQSFTPQNIKKDAVIGAVKGMAGLEPEGIVQNVVAPAVKQGFKNVRASSQVLATPLAAGLALPKGGATPQQAAQESLAMAKEMVVNREITPEKPVSDAAQMYLKKRQVGKYGGKDPNIGDVAVLSGLAFANLFGDPAFAAGELKAVGAAAKEFAMFKKVGSVTKPLGEGQSFVRGTTRDIEIPLSEDLKVKIKPRGKSVIIQGFKRRFGNNAESIDDVTRSIEEVTGRPSTAQAVGDDLIITQTEMPSTASPNAGQTTPSRINWNEPTEQAPVVGRQTAPNAPAMATIDQMAQPQTLYHGTAKGNIFDEFEIDKNRVGNGSNILHQGDAIYLTDSKQAADYFGTQATRMAKLRDQTNTLEEATGGEDMPGEVLQVQLNKGAKVKSLERRPNLQEVNELREQGFDAISFPEEAFNSPGLEGTNVSGLQSQTVVVFDPKQVQIQKPSQDISTSNTTDNLRLELDKIHANAEKRYNEYWDKNQGIGSSPGTETSNGFLTPEERERIDVLNSQITKQENDRRGITSQQDIRDIVALKRELRTLGIDFDPNTSKQELLRLLNETKNNNPPIQQDELVVLRKQIDKKIDDFRKEAGLMADKKGAGVVERRVEDATGKFKYTAQSFNLNKAKAGMSMQARDMRKYAREVLMENDPEFRSLVSRYEEAQLNAAPLREPEAINFFARVAGKKVKPPEKMTPEDIALRIEQLNKMASMNAILRKGGGVSSPRAAGLFVRKGVGVAKEGEVRMRPEEISSPEQYMSLLAHELGHAIDYHVTGTTNSKTWEIFGKDTPKDEMQKIKNELEAITRELEGDAVVDSNRAYYLKPTELFARFLQKMFESPGNLEELAPTAMEYLQKAAVRQPIIQEYLDAAEGAIDKGSIKIRPFRDMKQTYQKYLGNTAGAIAYGDEVAYRAMKERAKVTIENLVKEKFKGVKDDPALLFQAAESIKVTKNGVPEFGTRDFTTPKNAKEEAKIKEMGGWTKVDEQIMDGMVVPVYARTRYTPEQGREFYEQLSPKGKELIDSFTAAREEAKDYFNREVIKDVHGIESRLEGWVHHYWDEKSGGSGGQKFKFQVASAKKQRQGAEGYVEDLQKAIQKSFTELETSKVYNDFIERFFARVTKPIPEGSKPDAGWVEVVGDVKKGVGTQQEKKMVIIQDGKTIIPKQIKYQMPKPIYERFKLIRELNEEATQVEKTIRAISKYWQINILAHIGSAGTNFLSGGVQYSAKIMKDFYQEVLTGDVEMPQTKKNVSAMLKVLAPKGWMDAPDWVYGADLSNYYGQFTTQRGRVDDYGDKVLKLFGAVERYWKKVIITSEDVGRLDRLSKIDKNGLSLPTKEEREIIAQINDPVDLFALDYDNIPLWLQNHTTSVSGPLIKPFARYPYKYFKSVTNMVQSVFDRSLPWQERLATLMMLTTMVGAFSVVSNERRKKQLTPPASENTPSRMSPNGRLFIGTDKEGKEVFTRVSKYPYFNLAQAGKLFVEGETEDATAILSDMIGSLGPAAGIGLLAMNYRSKYDMYTPVPAIIGEELSTFIPFSRMLNDISRMLDPFQRKQTTFFQAFTKLIPTTDEDLQYKLHGDIRMESVPVEFPEQNLRPVGSRTTVDRELRNYWKDILLSFFTGVYVNRIDPDDAKAYNRRAEKNAAKKAKQDASEQK